MGCDALCRALSWGAWALLEYLLCRAREQLKVQNLQHQSQISTSFKFHHSQGTEVENICPADLDSEVPQEHPQLVSLWKQSYASQKTLDQFNTKHVKAQRARAAHLLSQAADWSPPALKGPLFPGQSCIAKVGWCLPHSLWWTQNINDKCQCLWSDRGSGTAAPWPGPSAPPATHRQSWGPLPPQKSFISAVPVLWSSPPITIRAFGSPLLINPGWGCRGKQSQWGQEAERWAGGDRLG